MSEFDDLDEVFGVLRGPATPSELSAETDTVDLMVSNHRRTGGSNMFTSRRSRVAVLIAAGVIGFGGVAAAGPGGILGDDAAVTTTAAPVVTDDEETTTTTTIEASDDTDELSVTTDDETTTVAEPTTDDLDTAEAVLPTDLGPYGLLGDPDDTTDFNEAYCVEGNHGKTVSAVARGMEEFEGVSVVEAAQSSCGKKATDDETDDADTEAEVTDDEIVTDEQTEPVDPSEPAGKDKDKANGNGRPDTRPAKSSEGRGNSGKKND